MFPFIVYAIGFMSIVILAGAYKEINRLQELPDEDTVMIIVGGIFWPLTWFGIIGYLGYKATARITRYLLKRRII